MKCMFSTIELFPYQVIFLLYQMYNPMYKHILRTLLVVALLCASCSAFPLFWPQPWQVTINPTATPLSISPCNVRYIVQSPLDSSIQSIIDFYLDSVFKCKSKVPANYSINIVVPARSINLPLLTQQDSYSLIIRDSGKWQLTADEYTGFLRGFETFSQVFQQSKTDFFIQGIPIVVDDKPQFKWRGLMIDSSRHFLSVVAIKRTIDALMFHKMNVLHWHIIDEDSFPMEIPAVPELSQDGMVGGTYSQAEIADITAYAKLRGVRVVVQIDTPAHTQSWGRSDKYRDIVVRCNSVYSGQFDPTLNLTYDVVTEVMKYVNSKFEDPYVHFGGDETVNSCWDFKPSIKEWMVKNNIPTYNDLSIWYRRKQKSLWRTLSTTKKVIYWANEAIDLPLEADDVVQWWGLTANLKKLENRPNEVILSNYDLTYLDVGFGNRNGNPYRSYIKWRDIYNFNPTYPGVNIIGGQTCMWSELSNAHTHDQKIWIRTSVLAERLWNDKISVSTQLRDIAKRLTAQAERMNKRGYKTSAVTVQICEKNMGICF